MNHKDSNQRLDSDSLIGMIDQDMSDIPNYNFNEEKYSSLLNKKVLISKCQTLPQQNQKLSTIINQIPNMNNQVSTQSKGKNMTYKNKHKFELDSHDQFIQEIDDQEQQKIQSLPQNLNNNSDDNVDQKNVLFNHHSPSEVNKGANNQSQIFQNIILSTQKKVDVSNQLDTNVVNHKEQSQSRSPKNDNSEVQIKKDLGQNAMSDDTKYEIHEDHKSEPQQQELKVEENIGQHLQPNQKLNVTDQINTEQNLDQNHVYKEKLNVTDQINTEQNQDQSQNDQEKMSTKHLENSNASSKNQMNSELPNNQEHQDSENGVNQKQKLQDEIKAKSHDNLKQDDVQKVQTRINSESPDQLNPEIINNQEENQGTNDSQFHDQQLLKNQKTNVQDQITPNNLFSPQNQTESTQNKENAEITEKKNDFIDNGQLNHQSQLLENISNENLDINNQNSSPENELSKVQYKSESDSFGQFSLYAKNTQILDVNQLLSKKSSLTQQNLEPEFSYNIVEEFNFKTQDNLFKVANVLNYFDETIRGTQQKTQFYMKGQFNNTKCQTEFKNPDPQSIQYSQPLIKSMNMDKEVLDKVFQLPTLDLKRIRTSLQEHLSSLDMSDHETLEAFFKEHYTSISGLDMKRNTMKLKTYKDNLYYGELFNNNRNGIGILIQLTSPLTIYEGYWQHNQRSGKGFQYFKNGNMYSGFFLNGKPNGFGCFYWSSGEVYTGQWGNGGVKHGSGLWTGNQGDEYLGEWKDGSADGYGVHKWTNGDRYEGEFKDSLKHGKGMEKFRNGDRYLGDYQNGKPSGYGDYTWANGNNYKGYFHNGLRQGKGLWKKFMPNQIETYDVIKTFIFKGQWFNDKKNGYGIYNYANNQIYYGDYCDNQRQGYGVMKNPDNSILQGIWEQGQLVQQQNHVKSLINSPQNQTIIRSYRASSMSKQDNLNHLRNNYSMINEQYELEMQVSTLDERLNTPKKAMFRIQNDKTRINFKQGKKILQSLTDQKFKNSQSQQNRRVSDNKSQNYKLNLTQQVSSSKILLPKKKQPSVQLTASEMCLWRIRAQKLSIHPEQFGNVKDQRTTERIRNILNSPVWKPPGQ